MRDRYLSSSLGSNSDGSEGNEMELRKALNTALASLDALRSIYDDRETRWIEEMRRLQTDRERVEMSLRQVVEPGYLSALPPQ